MRPKQCQPAALPWFDYCLSLSLKSFSASDKSSADPLPALHTKKGPVFAKWLTQKLTDDYNTWISVKFYNGAVWMWLSAQIYLGMEDFGKAAGMLLELCRRVKAGEANEENT